MSKAGISVRLAGRELADGWRIVSACDLNTHSLNIRRTRIVSHCDLERYILGFSDCEALEVAAWIKCIGAVRGNACTALGRSCADAVSRRRVVICVSRAGCARN